MPAIVPILLYIGLVIGAQAFQSRPKRVRAGDRAGACCPTSPQWATGLIDNALAAAGTTAAEVGTARWPTAGVVYDGLQLLGQGAVLAGMVLGAIACFVIDRRLLRRRRHRR